jgi:lipopolysaccharide biosynthesis regulator YciM
MYIALADVYAKKQEIASREAILRQGVSATWNSELVLLLVDMVLAKNDSAEAAKLLRTALEKHPDDAPLKERLHKMGR